MPHNLTDTPGYAAVTVPDDGDVRNAASVNVAFQLLANRDAYLLDYQTGGNMNGAFVRRPVIHNADAPSSGIGINVSAFAINVAAKVYAYAGGVYVASSPALAVDTWYNLYAKPSGVGTLSLLHSTTGLDATGMWKSDDATARFVCSFRTYHATATIVPFRKVDSRVTYARTTMAQLPTTSFFTANAAGWSTLCEAAPTAAGLCADGDTTAHGKLVPVHAKIATVRIRMQSTTTSGWYALLQGDGAASVEWEWDAPGGVGGAQLNFHSDAEVTLGAAQTITGSLINVVSNDTIARLEMRGWVDG